MKGISKDSAALDLACSRISKARVLRKLARVARSEDMKSHSENERMFSSVVSYLLTFAYTRTL